MLLASISSPWSTGGRKVVEERPKVAVGEPEGDQSASSDGEVEEAWLKQFRNFTLGHKCQVVFTYKYIQMLF